MCGSFCRSHRFIILNSGLTASIQGKFNLILHFEANGSPLVVNCNPEFVIMQNSFHSLPTRGWFRSAYMYFSCRQISGNR